VLQVAPFIPHTIPGWARALGSSLLPGAVWQLPATDKKIYLTFDDGPLPGPTEFVLDALAAYGAKGTFFAVGQNVQRYPALARRIIAEGHTLANHTQTHIKGWAHSTPAYLANTALCQQTIADTVGHAPMLFRPPYGRITPAQAKALQALGYTIVLWSVLTGDYHPAATAGACLRGAYLHCAPGALVVFHDSLKAAPRMQKALPALLHVLADEGYTFAALNT